MGLTNQYNMFRGQLLMMQPTHFITKAFSLLLQEESQRECANFSCTATTENIAINVKYNNLSKLKNIGTISSQKKHLLILLVSFMTFVKILDILEKNVFTCMAIHIGIGFLVMPKPKPKKLSAGNKFATQVSINSGTTASTSQSQQDA